MRAWIRGGLAALASIVLPFGSALAQDAAPAQDGAGFDGALTIAQRYDIRRTVDGRYAGLFYGYSLSTWHLGAPAADGGRPVQAHLYLTGDTPVDASHSPKPLAAESDARFVLRPDGSCAAVQGGGAPLYRGFPAPPPKDARPGDSWVAAGSLMLDPGKSGLYSEVPILVQYTLLAPAVWNGREVAAAKAKFAVRYRDDRRDPRGDPQLLHGEGTRDAVVYYDPASSFPVFVRETVGHETWDFKDGRRVVDNGFILTFFRGGPRLDGGESLADRRKRDSRSIVEELAKRGVDETTVREDPRGVAITLENLRFVADSPELLPGEETRLDRLAALLRQLPADKSVLVVGHTAAVGSPESQRSLSFERAKRIVEALKGRGVDGGRLLFDGKGGTQPVGDNATDSGRAKNRRVELIIID